MAVYTLQELKNRITDRIHENHERAIDGEDLQEMLHDVVDSLEVDLENDVLGWLSYYEEYLGHPGSDGQILSSTVDGHRSWVDRYTHPEAAVLNTTTDGPTVIETVTTDIYGHLIALSTRDLDSADLPAHTHDWEELTNIPTEFYPSDHTHVIADITDYVPGEGTGEYAGLTLNPEDHVIEADYPLNIGALRHAPDSGMVTVADMSITRRSEYGREMGYHFSVAGSAVFSVGAHADGAGGVYDTYASVHGILRIYGGRLAQGEDDNFSWRFGINSISVAQAAFTIGVDTLAYGRAALAMGIESEAYGEGSFAGGYQSKANYSDATSVKVIIYEGECIAVSEDAMSVDVINDRSDQVQIGDVIDVYLSDILINQNTVTDVLVFEVGGSTYTRITFEEELANIHEPDEVEITLGVVSDVHIWNDGSANATKKRVALANAITAFGNMALDVLINLGDQINNPYTGSPPEIDDYIDIIADLAGVPKYYAIGNHDLISATRAIWETKTGQVRRLSFDIGDIHIIILDVMFNSDGSQKGYPNNDTENPYYFPTAERTWLEDDLTANAGKRTIVFSHVPLTSGSHMNAADSLYLRELFAATDVIAVISGHAHVQAVSMVGDIPYITVEDMKDEAEKTPSLNAYSLLEFTYGGQMILTGFGSQLSHDLEVETKYVEGVVSGSVSTVRLENLSHKSGDYAVALGKSTIAGGEAAFAAGVSTTTKGYAAFALGRFNIDEGDPDEWVGTDPLFMVGIGADANNPFNALTLWKDGILSLNTQDRVDQLTLDGRIAIKEADTHPLTIADYGYFYVMDGVPYFYWEEPVSMIGGAGAGFTYTNNEVTPVRPLNIGALRHAPDTGIAVVMNMPVTHRSPEGAEMSYVFSVGDTEILRMGGYADGTGGISNAFATFDQDVAIAVAWANITGTPTTLAGYGIMDAYTKANLQTSGQAEIHWDNITNVSVVSSDFNLGDSKELNPLYPLNIGALRHAPDTGMAIVVDMPVTHRSVSGAEMSYVFNLAGEMLFKTGGYSDGAGGVYGLFAEFGGDLTMSVAWTNITGTPTTLAGYGITDAYTKTNLQTSGQAEVHWDNITNVSAISSDFYLSEDFGLSPLYPLNIGALRHAPDSGQITVMDMSVTHRSPAGTVQSYSFEIGGAVLMTIGAYSDGAGGIYDPFVELYNTEISATESDPTVPAWVKTIAEADITNWNTAYGWGNHAEAGYLTAETDPVFTSHAAYGLTSGAISNWNTAYGWGNHAGAGYLTSESDPTVGAHIKAITSTQITHWELSYGWGDHATVGYLTSNQSITLSGVIAGTGTTAITTTLNATAITNQSAIASMLATDEFIVSRSDVLKRVPLSAILKNAVASGTSPTDWENDDIHGATRKAIKAYVATNGGGGGSESTSVVNLGTGVGVFKAMNGAEIQLYKLKVAANGGMTITLGGDNNTINFSVALASNLLSYSTGGYDGYSSRTNGKLYYVGDGGTHPVNTGVKLGFDGVFYATLVYMGANKVATETYVSSNYLALNSVDDVAVDGYTTHAISSNWAYDHVHTLNVHDIAHVNGLTSALNDKASLSHTHTLTNNILLGGSNLYSAWPEASKASGRLYMVTSTYPNATGTILGYDGYFSATKVYAGNLELATLSALNSGLATRQAADDDLTAFAALDSSTGFIFKSGSNSYIRYAWGTSANTVAYGNHLHSGVYAPAAGDGNILTVGSLVAGNVDKIRTKTIIVQVFDKNTSVEVGTYLACFPVPEQLNGWRLKTGTGHGARVYSAGTGSVSINVCNSNSSSSSSQNGCMSPTITIDGGELDSVNAASPSSAQYNLNVYTGYLITVNVDLNGQQGGGSAARGLWIRLQFEKP